MEDWAHHILDIAENSVTAQASTVRIEINIHAAMLQMMIIDDGVGIDKELLADCTNPFATTRKTRKVGLGLALFAQSVYECDGDLKIDSEAGKGTCIETNIYLNHPDARPIGNLGEIFLALLVGYPKVSWEFECNKFDQSIKITSQMIKSRLGDVEYSEPEVIEVLNVIIRDEFNSWVENTPAFHKKTMNTHKQNQI